MFLLAAAAAFWPVWPWYLRRIVETPDERVGLVALGTALLFAWLGFAGDRAPAPRDLWLPAALLWTYVVAFAWLPPLVRAASAFMVLGCWVAGGGRRFGGAMPLGFAGLLLLALPVMPSCQFYLGFPLRQLTTEASALLLRLGGLAVVPEGACLRWGEVLVAVDAPCSGLRMAWTGGYLTSVLALLHRLDAARTMLAGALSLGVVVAANVLRASCLFYFESGLIAGEAWTHQGVGLVVFAGAAALIVFAVGRLAAPRRAEVVPAPLRSGGERTGATMRPVAPVLAGCLAAALVPLLAGTVAGAPAAGDFPGWPATFEGRPLTELPLTEREQRFTAGFPGRVGRFHDGEREIIIRWVARPTRKLHPASHCYAAHGYRVEPAPWQRDAGGRTWSALVARKDGEVAHVREAIRDPAGRQWADVSGWYWAAVWSRSEGPWWSYIVARTGADGTEEGPAFPGPR